MNLSFRVQPLDLRSNRAQFDCGVEALNKYFKTIVGQDARRSVSTCYTAIDDATGDVAGYYTLSACGIPLADFPPSITKRLPRYPTVPGVRIGRLAVDLRYRGQRLGGALLYDAIHRARHSGIAVFAVVVDAKNDDAVAFYERYGFRRFRADTRVLFIPICEVPERGSPWDV